MAKSRIEYVCENCGARSSKWIGKCPSCNEWNTYQEEVVQSPSKKTASSFQIKGSTPGRLSEIQLSEKTRMITKINELNRILGGGFVPGSVVLIGGEPGVGKSTLALQLVLQLEDKETLYISGEESAEQLHSRATRIGTLHNNCFVLNETRLESLQKHLSDLKPDLIIVDSIQTLSTDDVDSFPGSITQVRECTSRLLKYAKETMTPVVLIGHINKEGNLAGPKVLEHIVDVVLQFEGDRHHAYRILRSTKNRYGSTSELGLFEMSSTGLKEISNPSEILLSHFDEELSGVAISATLEGIRPLLIEVQSLVSSSVYSTPQRTSTGFDIRRLNMLLAVLEKRAGFNLSAKDVFLNIAGGIKVNDPAIDLAVIIAILSSNVDVPVARNICFAAEVGLSGEIRPVSRIDQRISEAEKLGFVEIYISKYNKKNVNLSKYKIGIKFVSKIEEVLHHLFSG